MNGATQLHPVEYQVKTLSAAQRHWPLHDEELYTIVDGFQKCRDWLVGVEVNVHTDYQGLQYFYTKQKLNSRQPSWYLHMSEFRYNIQYRPGTKMGKPDSLSRRSGEEKSGMDAKFFEQEQLLDLVEDANDNEGNADNIELEGIDVSKWDIRNGLWLVPEEQRLEVLRQQHNSQWAGHWGRQ